MRSALYAAAVAVLVLVAILWARRPRPGTLSRVDHERYRVLPGGAVTDCASCAPAEESQAADLLARVSQRLRALAARLHERYGSAAAARRWPERAQAARNVAARFRPASLRESSPTDPAGNTSFTIDKGSAIALCLREREARALEVGDSALKWGRHGFRVRPTPEGRVHALHDLELVTFVALHELAHVAQTGHAPDHPASFWRIFRFILDEAVAAGLVRDRDFAADPARYCGILINYNPRYAAIAPLR